MVQKEVEREEPEEEPDAQNGNVDRVYVCTYRPHFSVLFIKRSSSLHVSSFPRLFYQQTFRNEASPHLSSWSFRKPADNQHKSRRAL